MKITKEECDKLVELYRKAGNTPMIKFTSDPKEKDLSTLAWDNVRSFYDELGKKYNFDPKEKCINPQTLEIIDIP
jgi:hypothetical protein